MSNLELGIVVFVAMMLLIALRMPIAIALFLGGTVGFAMIAGVEPLLGLLNEAAYSRVATHSLTVIPLFMLMGQFASQGGISQALYRSARAWVGHFRGGIAMATIGGCAAFGAICGSSVATGATMATIAMPEMRRYGYSGALATGSLAAGGTLGILIPPSIILVIYAILTEPSLAHLFVAAIIPGVIAVVGYGIAIWVYVRINPAAGPAGEREGWIDPPAQPAGGLAGRGDLHRRDRRHLSRRLHADRGRRGRRRGDRRAVLDGRRHALDGDQGRAARYRADHRNDLPDPDRRGVLFLVPGAVATAAGAGGMDRRTWAGLRSRSCC